MSTTDDSIFIPSDSMTDATIGRADSSFSIHIDEASTWGTVDPISSSSTVIIEEGAIIKTDSGSFVFTDGKWMKIREKIEIIYNEKSTMKRITEILEKVYENHDLRKTIVPLFIGNPGLGKTVLIQEFAEKKGVKLVELITSQMSPFEISGIAMPDKEDQKMKYYNFDKLENLEDGDILFFDELLNGNPVVLNACLTILEQRKFISGKPLPNIMIVAAANPQGMAPLTPQIKERFVWYKVGFDNGMWKEYMENKYSMPGSITNKLCTLITREEFTSNNFYTPRSLDKAASMLIYDVPTPYHDTIHPILSELIRNPFDQEVTLPDGRTLAPDEMISWLELIRLKYS